MLNSSNSPPIQTVGFSSNAADVLYASVAIDKHNDDLNVTIVEQRAKLVVHEETLEKLRSQRERMLTKMKELKGNNEKLSSQLAAADGLLAESQGTHVDRDHRIDELEQQLRSFHGQHQDTIDECRAQQDLQETMKLENDSLKVSNRFSHSRHFEHSCRLSWRLNESCTSRGAVRSFMKSSKWTRIERNSSRRSNVSKRPTTSFRLFFTRSKVTVASYLRSFILFDSCTDALGHVDGDMRAMVPSIVKFRQDQTALVDELDQRNRAMQLENETLLLDVQQKESIVRDHQELKAELEKHQLGNEQHITELKEAMKRQNEQYQHLEQEYQSYRDEYERKQSKLCDCGCSVRINFILQWNVE